MNRTFLYLIVITFSSFLSGCSGSDNRNQAKINETIPAEKNDTVSAGKTDSITVQNHEIAEKTKTNAKPDTADFYKVFKFKNITFKVKATGKGSLQKVSIQPSGLTVINRAETLETDPIVNAEIGDLDADGYPELLLFSQSAGSGSYGKVIAFSVNNGKSMSRVTFPETSQIPEIKKGYRGHDKFTIVNNTLIQEFPIYNEGDVNSKPTRKKRVVTYKLKDSEASRVFVVDLVKEVLGK